MQSPRPAVPLEDLIASGTEVLVEWVDADGRRHTLPCVVDRLERETLTLRPRPGVEPLPEPGADVHARLGPAPGAVHAVARVVSDASGPVLRVTRPDTNGRRLFRVDVDLPVQTTAGYGRIINLSGAGCLMVPDAARLPEPGAVLGIRLRLPTYTPVLQLRARAVRHLHPEFRRPRLGLEFVEPGRREEDEIVRYVFLRQQELLRQGIHAANRDRGGEA